MNTKLRKARKDARLTQLQVAEIVGISETHYQNIEYDNNEPGARTAIRIAKALNSTVEELFDDTPDDSTN